MHASAPLTAGAPRPARSKRPMWHWAVLPTIGAIGALLIAILGVVLLWQILARGNPQDTLDDFYSSMANSDCELFMEATSEEFRSATGLDSCEAFDSSLAGVKVDYEVTKRVNRSGYAVFAVTESYGTDGGSESVDVEFYIRRDDGRWYMDGFAEAGPGSITTGG